MNIHEIAIRNQEAAREVIKETGVMEIWESIGGTVYPVGSLRTGLLMKNLDIDLHIYSSDLVIAESFRAIEKLAENPGIQEVLYRNLIDTEEECIEWHANYKDKKGNIWKLDMIHILRGSKYDGVVEHVTDTLLKKLTPEIKEIILQIKFDVPEGKTIPGIEIYRAVFSGGVRSYAELTKWLPENPIENTLDWLP